MSHNSSNDIDIYDLESDHEDYMEEFPRINATQILGLIYKLQHGEEISNDDHLDLYNIVSDSFRRLCELQDIPIEFDDIYVPCIISWVIDVIINPIKAITGDKNED